MKLYYSPGACSLAPHIILRELGLKFDLTNVDLMTKKIETGEDFCQINPRGLVPVMQFENEDILTEVVAILQYLADQHPSSGLAPKNATLERARLQEILNFLSSDLHKSFSPLFAQSTEEEKQSAIETVETTLSYLNTSLTGRDYLLGDDFSVADVYLFVILSWTTPTGIGLDKWSNLTSFFDRIAERSSVKVAMKAEGLVA